MSAPLRVCLAALVLGALGCGRDPAQLCDDFVDECGQQNSASDCKERAQRLESEAQAKQCLELWDQYVGCVDDLSSLCNAADECSEPRDNLAQYCGIHFE